VARSHDARYRDPGANLGFARAVNLGLGTRADTGRDVLLLNPDAEVDGATVRELHRRLHAEPGLAAVAPAQCDPGGHDQQVAWPFPSPGRAWLEATGLGRLAAARPQFLIGSVLLLHAGALDEVGGFDERYFLYAEEADWQWRAHLAGWRLQLCPDLHAVHVSGATSDGASERREALFHAGQERYIRTWFGAGGWQSYRLAALMGAVLRAAVLTGDRRRAAWDRAGRYVRGPSRVAAPYLPAAPDLRGAS
jgi:GT2 family glycosyltransferase